MAALAAVQDRLLTRGVTGVQLCNMCSGLAASWKAPSNPCGDSGVRPALWCSLARNVPTSILYTSKILKHSARIFCKSSFIKPCCMMPEAAAALRKSRARPGLYPADDSRHQQPLYARQVVVLPPLISTRFGFFLLSYAGFCIAARQAQLAYG